jgi:hypothetical protein
MASHFDAAAFGLQRGDVVGDVAGQGGKQAVLLGLGVWAEHGGDLPGQFRRTCHTSGPDCSHCAWTRPRSSDLSGFGRHAGQDRGVSTW